jgi:16S rRNA G966 N2-methylase RsmD
MAYHTALKGGHTENAEPISIYRHGDSIAFQHDIFNPYPVIYDSCDMIYFDPPWREGAKIFDERVGIAGRSFEQLTGRISELILETKAPVILSCGKWGEKMLPEPDWIIETDLKATVGKCSVYGYRTPYMPFSYGKELLPLIAQRFNVLGNWFCGYGNLAFEAVKYNKTFIVSDYNPQCIGYIKANMEAK